MVYISFYLSSIKPKIYIPRQTVEELVLTDRITVLADPINDEIILWIPGYKTIDKSHTLSNLPVGFRNLTPGRYMLRKEETTETHRILFFRRFTDEKE